MDQRRFDGIMRALAAGTTRRQGLAAALAALFGPAAGAAAARSRKRGAGKGPRQAGPCGDGSPTANACKRSGDCCTKYCDGGRCRCKPNWMTCARNEHCCSGRCAGNRCDGGTRPAGAACTSDFNCDSGLTCVRRVCSRRGKATCTPSKCSGCCESATCRPGSTAQACGMQGVACARCADGQSCVNGVCTAAAPTCGPANCATGCCQDGQCVTGASHFACGAGGAACVACSSLAPLCVTGACAAGTWTAQTPLGAGQPTSGTGNDQFHWPYGVEISANGLELYVGDSANNRIALWTRTSAAAAWQAQSPLLTASPGQSNATFDTPYGVALAAGDLTLYAADSANNRVAVLTRASAAAAWQPQTPLGQSAPNTGTGNGDFRTPQGVTAASDGLELYVGDVYNNRVAYWTRATAASALTPQAPMGSGQPSSGSGDGQFNHPVGIAISANGLEMYVADSDNYRVSVWTRDSDSSQWQWQDNLGNDYGTDDDQFYTPTDVALAADDLSLYVADKENHRIEIWTRDDASSPWQAQTPLGNGQPNKGSANDQFSSPYSVALSLDATELYVADSRNNRIAVWRRV